MGDNAGGNICLTLCLYIKEKKLTNPGAVVLLCPILDLSMSHGEIIEKDYHDVLHSKKGV
jgi:acetyl esterase/lipase